MQTQLVQKAHVSSRTKLRLLPLCLFAAQHCSFSTPTHVRPLALAQPSGIHVSLFFAFFLPFVPFLNVFLLLLHVFLLFHDADAGLVFSTFALSVFSFLRLVLPLLLSVAFPFVGATGARGTTSILRSLRRTCAFASVSDIGPTRPVLMPDFENHERSVQPSRVILDLIDVHCCDLLCVERSCLL